MDNSQIRRFSTKFFNGTYLLEEGLGDGYSSYPNALDKYERALGLNPPLSWLVKRMISHAWNEGTHVYLSMNKIRKQTLVSSSSLNNYLKKLKEYGYIESLGTRTKYDRRIEYDIAGIYNALNVAFQCDIESDYYIKNKEYYLKQLGFEIPPYSMGVVLQSTPFFKNYEELCEIVDRCKTPIELISLLKKLGLHLNWGAFQLTPILDEAHDNEVIDQFE